MFGKKENKKKWVVIAFNGAMFSRLDLGFEEIGLRKKEIGFFIEVEVKKWI